MSPRDLPRAELAAHRVDRWGAVGRALMAGVGTETVGTNLTVALEGLFGPSAPRDGSPTRAREPGTGSPSLDDASALIAGYLAAERSAGRLGHDADEHLLAFMLIGGARMLVADGGCPRPDGAATLAMTRTVLGVD